MKLQPYSTFGSKLQRYGPFGKRSKYIGKNLQYFILFIHVRSV